MASERDEIERAVEEFYEYAEALLRRAQTRTRATTCISMLIEAEEAGERLSDVECINLVFNVLAGGVDTTQSQLAHAVRLLAENPEQWQLLVADPAARPGGRRGGAAVRADHAVHRAHDHRGGRLPRRELPARTRS